MVSKYEQKINQMSESVVRIETVLLGANGGSGLCERFDKLAESHYKLKRTVVILISFLAGSGVLGVSVWQILLGG